MKIVFLYSYLSTYLPIYGMSCPNKVQALPTSKSDFKVKFYATSRRKDKEIKKRQ